MITDCVQSRIRQFQKKEHAHCIVCGMERNVGGLGLFFKSIEDGSVQATFDCAEYYSGYQGRLHGGVVASLLDGAMTNCLAGQGYVAVTAELKVRYKKPVLVNEVVEISAYVEKITSWIYYMKAVIKQKGQICASAQGKFIQQNHLSREAVTSS